MTEEVLYRDWTARQFWYKHLFLAWKAFHKNEYNRIIAKKYAK